MSMISTIKMLPSFVAICSFVSPAYSATKPPIGLTTVTFETPFFAECVPYSGAVSAQQVIFAARTTKAGDEFVLLQLDGEKFSELVRFSPRPYSVIIAPPPPQNPQEKDLFLYGIANVIAVNNKQTLLGKMNISSDAKRVFFAKTSSIAIATAKKSPSDANVFEYDMKCENIFSDDVRFDWLIQNIFAPVSKRKK